jgi:hypothetical protein
MKKYKYRIIKKREYSTYTTERKEITFLDRVYNWEHYLGGFATIDAANEHILKAIKNDLMPEFEVIKEINPYA